LTITRIHFSALLDNEIFCAYNFDINSIAPSVDTDLDLAQNGRCEHLSADYLARSEIVDERSQRTVGEYGQPAKEETDRR
jgi:hypothetical protein